MSEHLLSLLHIDKLGHPIEEIRIRALSSVISKYNLNLVDETNVRNTKLLLQKLINWFDFEHFSEEEKVLKLIIQVLNNENVSLILKESDVKDIIGKITNIEKKIGDSYPALVQKIKKCINEAPVNFNNYHSQINYIESKSSDFILNGNSIDENEKNCVITDTFFKQTNHSDAESPEKDLSTDINSTESKDFKNDFDFVKSMNCHRIEYFPWQHLIPGDKHILSSVYDGLRYVNNKNSILQTCQFFKEVVLRDFPAEIFIQRPLIIRTFLQLLENGRKDVRIPVITCLLKTIHNVKENSHLVLNASMFHLKEEFYSTSLLPTDLSDKDDCSEQSVLLECFQFNTDFYKEDMCDNDNDILDQNLKKYQLSLSRFCFEILLQSLLQLKKNCCKKETNYLITLSFETLELLTFNIVPQVCIQNRELKSELNKMFKVLEELLKNYRKNRKIFYIILLYITIKLLNSLTLHTKSDLKEILPSSLYVELGICISDFILVLLFPDLHFEVLKYLEGSSDHNKMEILQDYKDFLMIFESMKSSMKFLKCLKTKTKMEKLELVYNSLASLNFHQNLAVINYFVDSCLLKWRKSQLNDEESKMREKVLLKLLAHNNVFVRVNIYKEINEYGLKLLGVDEAIHPKYEFPGDRMDFLFYVEVLNEIICHGLSSSLVEVRKYSNEIMIHLLKSKFLMSENCWSDFINALIPCLSLLQCFGDKSSTLGRCIVKMFDPDIAKSNGLPLIEVLKGNIRFLFSKNSLTRDEALSRLLWLLSKEDRGKEKLPRMSVLTGLNLSGICSCVKPEEFPKIRRPIYNSAKLSDVVDMLSSENMEPNLRRSALSQISVMIDDVHLHYSFLEQKGLDKILKIMNNCLIEKEYLNYPDSVIPIVYILKVLSLHNVSVRQDLSSRLDVLYGVLRSLFLFSSDDSLRQSAVELLCLLLYNDCILRVPQNVSNKSIISFPDIVVNKMCLPFVPHIHWKNSKHLEASTKKTLMSDDGFSKLIRTSYAVQWVGNLSDVLSMQPCDLLDKAYSPGLPDEMKILYKDIEELKNCAFGVSVKQTLYSIQNATTHEAVFDSLNTLHSYLLLYNIDKAVMKNRNKNLDSETTLSHMLWESSLERFVLSNPSCHLDDSLLLEVIKFLQLLLRSFKSERLINWVGKLLIDENQVFMKILRKIGSENYGYTGRELRLSIIELAQQIVSGKNALDMKWFSYLELVSNYLKLDKKEEFYNVAYIDWLLSLMVDLTGKQYWNFAGSTEFLENLIIRIMEIIVAFHCTKDSGTSFMGINIIRNSLFVLNHILSDLQTGTKEWEKIWFQAFSKIIDHKENANFCWLLSLWFMRDTVTRALAFQLFVGLSNSTLGCEYLISRLNVPFEQIWTHGFNIFFDESECGFVREKVALFLSNLTNYGTKISCGYFLEQLQNKDFYQETLKIILNTRLESNLSQVILHSSSNRFEGEVIATPSFITSISALLQNILSLDPTNVSYKFLESGLIDGLIKVLTDLPELNQIPKRHQDGEDILEMYINICKLLTKCATHSWSIHSFLLQSPHCVNNFFSLINYNLFCECSRTLTVCRNELWCEILQLFSVLLMNNPETNRNTNNVNAGFVLLNRCMNEKETGCFISSLYFSLTSDMPDLRASVLNFFINLFRHEMTKPKQVSISDIFDRKISSTAIKLSAQSGWKGLTISESLSLNFGIRVTDILHQLFLFSTSCVVRAFKTTVADCFGSLMAVCKTAQNYSVEKGLPDFLVTNLKQICVKLNLENVENFKKPNCKKKIDPMLLDLETLFRLICNLMLNNEKSKNAFADCALSSIVHKLWPWCMIKPGLQIVTLKMLCTFTHFCDQGCRTLILSAGLSVLGLKKSSSCITLMNAIINQICLEMDLISKTHDSHNLCLCLQLLSNCCRVTECRSVMSKGNFLQSFMNIYPGRRKRTYGKSVIEAWLKFFAVFSSYQEGQLALTKNQDVLDLLITMSGISKNVYRINALTILRNICFHQLNRIRMLSCGSFLTLMCDILESKKRDEVQAVVIMLWALTYNTQKAKVIIRSSGFEAKLVTAKRNFIMKEDLETAELIEMMLDILKNK